MKHKKTPEEIKEYKRNYNKQRAEYLAEHNFCRWCGKQKALEGKALCWDCMNKSCEYGFKRYHSMTEEERKAQRQKKNEYRRVRYQIRKEKVLCTQCGKRKPMGGKHCVSLVVIRKISKLLNEEENKARLLWKNAEMVSIV